MVHALDEVGRISDSELVGRVERLVKADRALTAKLIVHLGEVEVRGLHHERSYSSMFEYCRSGLGMSEGEAALRILAARVARKFPLVLERLGAGDVNLTGIRLLAPLLTVENHVRLLDRVHRMPKRKIEVLVAELAPKPDVPARMRKLPERRAQSESNSAATMSAPCTTARTSGELCAPVSPASPCSKVLTPDAPALVMPLSTAPSCATTAQPSASPASPCKVLTPDAPALVMPLSTAASSVRTPQPSAAPTAPCNETLASHAPAFVLSPSNAILSETTAHPTAPQGAASVSRATFALQSPRARASLKPLSPGRWELKLTVGQEAHDALEQLVELLRHQNPSGDMTSIVERALCELIKREMKRRFGQTNAEPRGTREAARVPAARPDIEATSESTAVEVKGVSDAVEAKGERAAIEARRQSDAVEAEGESAAIEAKRKTASSASKSRYIPRKVLREVHARDNGQCTYISEDGRRCSERGFLQVHHHNTTFARGGDASVENLRIMCRAHNMHLARQDYGRQFMQNKLREAAARK